MKINSMQNNLQSFEGKFVIQNYNRSGKMTVRETSPKFDKEFIDYLKKIIEKYPKYIFPISEIEDLKKILKKILITLPPAHMTENGKARFWGKVDDKNNGVFEILGAFRINLNA